MDGEKCFEDFDVWNRSSLNAPALHALAQQCLSIGDSNVTFVYDLYSPSTFFLQLVRLSVTLCIVTVLLGAYNYVRVLEQPIISTATCSIYWVIFYSLAALKSGVLVILVPISHYDGPLYINTERFGFIAITIVQLAASFVLYLALHHEVQYRSSEFATIDSPLRKSCIGLRAIRRMCSWHRIVVLAMTLVSLLYLVAIEVAFHLKSDVLSTAVVWPFILLLPVPRLAAVVVAIYVMVRRKSPLLQPTVLAKVYLCVATVLSLMEDIPNSVTTIAPEHPNCTCLLGVMSMYDVLQLIGLVALLFYAMFVRSQYLRVEEESKLSLVEELQRLLQVNGRKDVISRDYTSAT